MRLIAQHLVGSGKMWDKPSHWLALVVGRAGLDLYPQPDGGKAKDAQGFAADMGGSAGNIAAALGVAGNKVALASVLSQDLVGDFVRQGLATANVDASLVQLAQGGARTSLALAEVRDTDCEVVIYRNDAADLQLQLTEQLVAAVENTQHLVITGTSLIAEPSRSTCLQLMQKAQDTGAMVWFDLDYRPWNWPDQATTRALYLQAAALSHVIVGNEDECAVLNDSLPELVADCRRTERIVLLKRGGEGSRLFLSDKQLDSGIYPTKPLKPYGAGDAFLGNLIHHYSQQQDWQAAIAYGSAAAAIVVATRGCASAMPCAENIIALQEFVAMTPAACWH